MLIRIVGLVLHRLLVVDQSRTGGDRESKRAWCVSV
jgi:hypothetical protein